LGIQRLDISGLQHPADGGLGRQFVASGIWIIAALDVFELLLSQSARPTFDINRGILADGKSLPLPQSIVRMRTLGIYAAMRPAAWLSCLSGFFSDSIRT
jgi:hypothetical protein